MSANSKNSFHGSSNFKSDRKPWKPTNTDDKPAETGPQSSNKKEAQSDSKAQTNQEEDEMLVTKL